nr:unnamed protein product [Callosobruchus chinensis]
MYNAMSLKRQIASFQDGSRTTVHCIGNVHNIGEIMLTVDLQNCLITPVMTNSQSFYSLKLWTYNYPLYDSTNKVTTCVM